MRINLEQAVQALKQGEVIAVPTETVYGLAASMEFPIAIQRIFDLKRRPANNPLIIHVAVANQIRNYAREIPPYFDQLAHSFWPGPMTLILPIYPQLVPSVVCAELKTAGFRVPQHPLAQALLSLSGPLVMPSANLSGRPSSTSPFHVEEDFGAQFPVLDGGMCKMGLESTILGWDGEQWIILRLGVLTSSDFESVLGYHPPIASHIKTEKPICPGQLFRHYSPKAKLILGDETRMHEVSCILGFRERVYPENKRILILGSLNNPKEVAENLYCKLRQLDEEIIPIAWVDTRFSSQGLWITIAERLNRASSC